MDTLSNDMMQTLEKYDTSSTEPLMSRFLVKSKAFRSADVNVDELRELVKHSQTQIKERSNDLFNKAMADIAESIASQMNEMKENISRDVETTVIRLQHIMKQPVHEERDL